MAKKVRYNRRKTNYLGNLEKANDARNTLSTEYPHSNVSVMLLDLADFSSIDVFVNNAGVFHQPGKKTKDGFELVMGTNYFGVYYLTKKLLPYLTSLSHEVVYVNTISMIHKVATLDYEDFYYTKSYRNLKVYARSKLCLAKYTYYTANRLKDSNVRMLMNHPGMTITPMGLNAVGPRIAK